MRALWSVAGAVLLAACTAVVPGPGPGPARDFAISAVTVETSLSAVRSREAVAYWQGLKPDLETAIAQEFIGEISPGGRAIAVRIVEIALAGPEAVEAGAEAARLAGRVDVVEPATGRVMATYDLAATASEAFSEGDAVVGARTSTEYYITVVEAFARGVAEVVRAGG